MSYFDILRVPENATETHIRRSYIKLAKQYHPDRYKGANKDHFKKISEAYQVLKNPLKRRQYEQKVHSMRGRAPRFTDIPEEEIRRNPEKYSRQEIDPEFLEELKKQDFAKQLRLFQARPLRNDPERMEIKKINTLQEKLSKQERKRREYVREHRRQEKLKFSVRHRILNEYDRLKEVQLSSQGRFSEQRGYHALAEELRKQP